MKIICLCKRKPQGKDLYTRPYGRFYYLAKGLADSGHEVNMILMNYSKCTEFVKTKNNINWHSVNLIPNPFNYYSYVKKITIQIKADWIIGFSDIYFGICAQRIAKIIKCHSLIDAYDNYECYIPGAKPLHWLWRNSLQKTDIITAAGPALLKKMSKGRRKREFFDQVIEMAADPGFNDGSKQEARINSDLPLDMFIIGYSGSMTKKRGVETMLQAFSDLSSRYPDVLFVFSGRKDKNISLEKIKNKVVLGYVEDSRMPDIVKSFDLLVSVNQNSVFGNYSYPVKLYEALASQTAVVASKTHSTSFVLREYPDALFEANSISAMVSKIEQFIQKPYRVIKKQYSWKTQVIRFEKILTSYQRLHIETD